MATWDLSAFDAPQQKPVVPTPRNFEPIDTEALVGPDYSNLPAPNLAAFLPPPVTVPQAQPQAPEPNPKPFFSAGDTASALWEGATQHLVPGFKSALAQAYTGLDRPDQAPDWAQRWQAEGRQSQQQANARIAELQAKGESSSIGESIREAIPSIGFSGVSMLSAIPAAIGAGAATQAAVPIPGSGLVGGMLGAGAASGTAGYRMAGASLLNEAFAGLNEESIKQRGRPLDEAEKQRAYDELLPVAQNTGLWEAGPEAIGNAAMLGLGKVALNIGMKAVPSLLQRLGAAAAGTATEVGTEGVTQYAQGNDQQKAQAYQDAMLAGQDPVAAMAAAPQQYQGAEGLWQATKDVAPATLATVGLMGAAAKGGHLVGQAIERRGNNAAAGELATQAGPVTDALVNAPDEALSGVLARAAQIKDAGNLSKSAVENLDAAIAPVEAEVARRTAMGAATPTGEPGYSLGLEGAAPPARDAYSDLLTTDRAPNEQELQQGIEQDRQRLGELAQSADFANREQAIREQEAQRGNVLLRGLLGAPAAPAPAAQPSAGVDSLDELMNRPSRTADVRAAPARAEGQLPAPIPAAEAQAAEGRRLLRGLLGEAPAPAPAAQPSTGGFGSLDELMTRPSRTADVQAAPARAEGRLFEPEPAPAPAAEAPAAPEKAPWKMTLDEFAQSRIDASGYADAYREDPEAADAFKKEQGSKWVDALRARAEEGRISDSVLDDFVGRHGMPALQREFRGSLEKGIEGYQPPDVRNGPTRKMPGTIKNQPWQMTWEEYRKEATPDGFPDKAAKTPAYWKALKNQHRDIIARALSRKENVSDRVFSDYPDLKAPPAAARSANPYATPEDRDAAISRLNDVARNHESRSIRERADLIGDAVNMGATEAEMMAAIEAGDGDALEAIAERQYQKTGGMFLGFGTEKPATRTYGDASPQPPHPADDYKNWNALTDDQVKAFAKAAGINPSKDRIGTLDRIDELPRADIWKAWDRAFQAPAAKKPAPTFDELKKLDLIDEFGGKWRYKMQPGGRWYIANSKDGAIDGATTAHESANKNELMTRQERDQKADKEWFDDMDSRYGALSDDQIENMIDKEERAVQSLRRAPDKEISDGKRRTGAATSNEGARTAAEMARNLRRYLEQRGKKPKPPAQQPKDLILWGYKPGTADEPIKLGQFSKGEQARREKDGWKTVAYAKGDEPTGLKEQAKKEAAKAPAPDRPRQQVVTASGRQIDTEFEVVELDDLITSDRAEFPKALQPRDRSRLSSADQVAAIAGKLDPQQLADSRLASDGAPIVGPDNVVESGNGRTMALREVYGRERLKDRADAYRVMIESKGLSTADMRQPVLVRRRTTAMTEGQRKAFAEEANARNTLGMSPAERAMVHAGRMNGELLDQYKGGDLTTLANAEFVRGFIGKVAPDEAAEMRTADGMLNQEGIRRIESAILAKAYPDSALLGALLESTDNNIKAIGGALLDSAPAMVGLKGKIEKGLVLPQTDISAEVVEAARLVAKARRENRTLSELLAQSGMFGDDVSPPAKRIVRLFFADDDLKRQISRDKIAGLLNTYADLAKSVKPGDPLFADIPAVTVGDIIDTLEKKHRGPEKQQQSAFFGGNPARPSGATGGSETRRPGDGAPGTSPGAAEQGPSQEDDLGKIFDEELEKAFANAPSTGESVERDRESDRAENGVGTENVPAGRGRAGRSARKAGRTDEGGGLPEQGGAGVSNAPAAMPGKKRAGGVSAKDGTVRPGRGATGTGDSGRGGQPGGERVRSARGKSGGTGRAAKAADAGVKAGQAAVEVTEGLKKTMDALATLFGGKSKFSSGLTFDEDTYRQAVPHFKEAIGHFKEAGKNAREAIRLLIQAMMGVGYEKDALAAMKPYAIRFVTDVQNGVIDLAEAESHAEPETIEPARLDYAAKLEAQRVAESVAAKSGDIENIRATLPYLLPEQQDDVLKAEQRFESANGILFTNATGTGKTYTGLGVIKRMVKMGKGNILIVVPSQTKAQDWIEDGKNLGLDIALLPDTQTAGKDQVITTYANLYENDALDRSDWDAIVYDESHKLASNQAGNQTVYQDRHERLTLHSNSAISNRAASFLTADERATRDRIFEKVNKAKGENSVLSEQDRSDLSRINEKIAQIAQDLSAKPRPKVVFLSATPFAYHKSLDYADKLLFDYEDGFTPGYGYNQPNAQQAFLIRHFGYRMRTGKLTEPDVNVDVDLMERRFHEWLKRTGAVSGRKLEVEQDYSRKFVDVADNSEIGKQIDRGIDIINGYHKDGRDDKQDKFPLLADVLKNRLDFLAKSRLLEAIKAESAAKRARQHIALGRKVVIFHDYIEGDNKHPFKFPNIDAEHIQSKPLNAEIDRFNREFPELVNMDLGKLSTVIAAFQREFGDKAKFFNGRETGKNRARAIAEFNRDDDAAQVIVVQRDAGKEGISLHDVTGKIPRALIDLGLPTAPTEAIQTEGRIYRFGQKSDAIIEYLKTGTRFEEHMFASRVASRARTAENLAMGDSARNLEQAFVDAYLNSAADAPSTDQGTGGKAADARVIADAPFDVARALYFGQRKRTSRDKSREGVDYFATPEPLGLKMVEWADASTGDSMLEPSAGHGAIARWFPEDTRNTFVEPSRELSVQLGLNARGGKILDHGFESLHATNKYDAIVMNPPFGLGGATAIAHLDKAAGHLKNGGRIVVLYPEGPTADKRMSAFIAKANGLYTVADFGLPPVVFERAGTTVKTRVLVLEKQLNPADAPNGQSRIDFAADTIGEFFDKIRDLSVKPRNKPTAEPDKAETAATPADRATVSDLVSRSDESWLTERRDGVRRVLSKDGIKAAIDGVVPELAQEDQDVAVAFVRMGRSTMGGLVPNRATNRLLSLGMAIPNQRKMMALTAKGKEAFDRYAAISGALRSALDAKYSESAAPAPSSIFAVKLTLHRTTHAKKSQAAGKPVPWFAVSLDNKVSNVAYTAMAAKAKELGGYWSSYRGQGAVPGFQFTSEQAANDFIAAIEGNRFSIPREASDRPASTVAQVRERLAEALGQRRVAALEKAGKLVVHGIDASGVGAAGFIDKNGVMHLIAPNLHGDALSVALHEEIHLLQDSKMMDHDRTTVRLAHAALRLFGLKDFIGSPSFSDLVEQAHRLAATGNEAAQRALAQAKKEAPNDVDGELVAYLVEYAPPSNGFVRKVLAAIRAALYRMGFRLQLTPADLRALALGALRERSGKTHDYRSNIEFRAKNSRNDDVIAAFTPERSALTLAEAKDKAREFVGKPLVNDATRLTATVSNANLAKMTSQSAVGKSTSPQDHAMAIANVDSLFESALLDHSHDDAKGEPTIKAIHRYVSAMIVDGEVLAVKMTVKETVSDKQPNPIYSVETLETTKPALEAPFGIEREPGQDRNSPQAGFSSNVRLMLKKINDEIRRQSRPADEDQDALWAEFQAVRAQFQARQPSKSAFMRWFGKGYEGITARDGKPITLYHGTDKPAFHRWDETRAGQASGHPTSGLGFFMTADKRTAARYGSRLLALNAKIERPYFLSNDDLVSIETPADAAKMRKRLMAKGYDGAVVTTPGAAPYVIAFESKQAKYTDNESPTESPDFRYSMPSMERALTDSRHALEARGGKPLATVKTFIKRLQNPLYGIADLDEYMKSRYLAQGKIGEAKEESRALYDTFAKASAADGKAIFEYLTTPGASLSAISDAMRPAARDAKKRVDEIGRRLVKMGALSQAAYDKYKDQYLPRLYLRHLLDDDAIGRVMGGTGTGRTPDLSWTKHRKDIPEEVRRLQLGEIRDPAYLLSHGVGTELRDAALLDWLETISQNQKWVLPKTLVDWNGHRVTPFWLKSEAAQIRKQMIYYADADKAEAAKLADKMDETADRALKDYDGVPEGWRQLPNTPKYGALRGMVVQEQIHGDIVGGGGLPGDASLAESILGDRGALSRATAIWKWPLALDTKIPTPSGWTTMGDIKVGDKVFSEDGKPCDVLAVHEILHDRDCYSVAFSDGTSIVADGDHLWMVVNSVKTQKVLSTREIKDTLLSSDRGDRRHSIPVTKPLILLDADLPIPPYALGVWLGDGVKNSARVCAWKDEAEEIRTLIESSGVKCGTGTIGKNGLQVFSIQREQEGCLRGHGSESARPNNRGCKECEKERKAGNLSDITNPSIPQTLRELGVFDNKHIPKIYLRASAEQRMALLQGLMDTDGTIEKTGVRCRFSTSIPALRDDMLELLRSLGYKPMVMERIPINAVTGKQGNTSWNIGFTAYRDTPVFRLTRKLNRLPQRPESAQRSNTRQIVSITEVPSVPVRCISVSSESELFLAGDGFIPTHNSKVAANPPGQIRNFVGNGVLLHLSGVPFAKVPLRIVQAFNEIRDNGAHFQVAKRYGVTESGFTNQELQRINTEFKDSLARAGKLNNTQKARLLFDKFYNFTGDLYQFSEALFKTAKIIDEMSKGASESDAALAAQAALFDYSLVSPSLRYLRNAPLGMPFATFISKALPMLLETAAKHPMRFAPYVAIPYVLSALLASLHGLDDDDVESLQAVLPKWQREKGHTWLLPYKDAQGRWQAMDFGYFLPWTALYDIGNKAVRGKVGEAIMTAGVLGSPVLDIASAIATNTDNFTKKEIANRYDPPAVQVASIMNYAWRLAMPTFLTDIGVLGPDFAAMAQGQTPFAGKLAEAALGKVDKRGEPRTTMAQAVARLFGANLYPIAPEFTRADNLRGMRMEISRTKARMTAEMKDPNLTPAERRAIAEAYRGEIEQRVKELQEYAAKSRITPAIRTKAA